MRFLFLIPGTGHFFCGSCLRDNDLALALREAGHEVDVEPLYLPFFLEEGTDERPVNLGGVNLYLACKRLAPLVPRWLKRVLDRPGFLRWAAQRGDMTDASGLGALTLAMLRGEDGPTRAEIQRLASDLGTKPKPDVVVLSNAMLLGLAREIKRSVDVPLLCTLQGEAPFLDAIGAAHRELCWEEVRRGAQAVDRFIAVSASYGELMGARLQLPPERISVVLNGVNSAHFGGSEVSTAEKAGPPVIGYLARQCADKGLHTLVDAYCLLEESGRRRGARLLVLGVELAVDHAFVREQKAKLASHGLADQASFHPNVTRAEKLAHLSSMSLFSVPATYGESFGMPVIEAMASGVPVVQPRHGAFPEVLEATGGGLLCEPDDAASLADGLARLLEDEELRATLGSTGRASVLEHFTQDRAARELAAIADELTRSRSSA